MYNHVVLGGTFDHLHLGHTDLLTLAFSSGKKVTLGLTTVVMNRSKDYASEIQSYALRAKAIKEFARGIHRSEDLTIIPIKDIYGSTLRDKSLDAIIVTEHTQSGAAAINASRAKLQLPALPIVLCALRTDAHGETISSSRIRKGEIDRSGKSYLDLFSHNITISPDARKILSRPIGKAIGAKALRDGHRQLIIVGDVSTQYCVTHQVPFRCAWIDGRTRKKEFSFTITPPYSHTLTPLHNPAGTITSAIAHTISVSSFSSKNMIFQITGEEDLLTVAAVVLLPFGTTIVYGYPYAPATLRAIRVNERTKNRFAAILQI